MHQNPLEGLLINMPCERVLSLISSFLESEGLGWGLRICSSEKLLGDADAGGLGNPILWN